MLASEKLVAQRSERFSRIKKPPEIQQTEKRHFVNFSYVISLLVSATKFNFNDGSLSKERQYKIEQIEYQSQLLMAPFT